MITQRPDSESITEDLLPLPHAAKRARDVATEACLRWELEPLTASAALIASELVSNVVDHAHTMMTLEVTRLPQERLRLAVHDGSTRPPVMRPEADLSGPGGGLGLRLVDHNSTTWGYVSDEGGKTVWATLSRASGG